MASLCRITNNLKPAHTLSRILTCRNVSQQAQASDAGREYDALVSGAGDANLRSAFGQAEKSSKTATITKLFPIGLHAGVAKGGINTTSENKAPDDWKSHMNDTIKGSNLLSNQDAIHYMTKEPPAAVVELEDNLVSFSKTPTDPNKASLEKLTILEKELEHHLPKFFHAPHPLQLYTKDLVFIDNTRNVKCNGFAQYSFQINLIKIYYHLNYSSSKFTILNLVKNPEESSLKIRWRIVAKPGLIRAALFFWKFKGSEIWRDGLSTMYVNQEGKIFCHICDNIDVDSKEAPSPKQTLKDRLVNRGLVSMKIKNHEF